MLFFYRVYKSRMAADLAQSQDVHQNLMRLDVFLSVHLFDTLMHFIVGAVGILDPHKAWPIALVSIEHVILTRRSLMQKLAEQRLRKGHDALVDVHLLLVKPHRYHRHRLRWQTHQRATLLQLHLSATQQHRLDDFVHPLLVAHTLIADPLFVHHNIVKRRAPQKFKLSKDIHFFILDGRSGQRPPAGCGQLEASLRLQRLVVAYDMRFIEDHSLPSNAEKGAATAALARDNRVGGNNQVRSGQVLGSVLAFRSVMDDHADQVAFDAIRHLALPLINQRGGTNDECAAVMY